MRSLLIGRETHTAAQRQADALRSFVLPSCRSVIPRGGRFGLADHSMERLGRAMGMDQQTSNWDEPDLSNEQKLDAAKDVIDTLRINARLQLLPGLSLPLAENYAIPGIEVDMLLVPSLKGAQLLKVPALPWRKDRKLLTRLILETKGKKMDTDTLCYDILGHVDGVKVFSKLAVYNRCQLKVVEHTSRVHEE
jgi:hypothetical protein